MGWGGRTVQPVSTAFSKMSRPSQPAMSSRKFGVVLGIALGRVLGDGAINEGLGNRGGVHDAGRRLDDHDVVVVLAEVVRVFLKEET